jgi:DNA repair exonuclease SbcCD nuclease subunit
MKIVCFTDPHIRENSLGELENIFQEIISYDADMCICVGDFLERRPTPKEIYFATEWSKKFVDRYKRFVLVVGNHPQLSKDFSSEDYLKFLGVELYNTVFTMEDNGKKYAFPHLMCQDSLKYFNTEQTFTDIDKYDGIILGHQHIFQEINEYTYHLGSCRFVDFGEASVPVKYIAIIDEGIEFIELNNVIPMVSVKDIKELAYINPNSKVCITINDFETFKNNINQIEQYKKLFYQFKLQLNFKNSIENSKELQDTEISFDTILREWLEKIEDKDVKKILSDELIKNDN